MDVRFKVPAANTDGTRPANISRVDVYAFSGPPNATDDQLLKHGTRIGSVAVKAPRDPDRTIEPNESRDDMEPLEGDGLDQGAAAQVEEELTAVANPDGDPAKVEGPLATDGHVSGPLLGPSASAQTRTYVGVSITKRGRKGPISARAAVPLVPPPPMPSSVSISYGETSITVTWTPPSAPAGEAPAADGVLPSRPLGPAPAPLTYNVYDATTDALLTRSPVSELRFVDTRVDWGAERCYTVRAVEAIGPAAIESDAASKACTVLVDTFPPAPPKGLVAVAGEAAISLIWQANQEKDLAGYVVLRGPAPADQLQPITVSPIQEPTFRDEVQPGTRYVYAVQAVDRAGNHSEPSNRVEEAAR